MHSCAGVVVADVVVLVCVESGEDVNGFDYSSVEVEWFDVASTVYGVLAGVDGNLECGVHGKAVRPINVEGTDFGQECGIGENVSPV